MPKPILKSNRVVFFLFGWLLLIHTLLAYMSFPIVDKLWIFIVGWGIALAFRLSQRGSRAKAALEEANHSGQAVPLWFTAFVILAALGLRLLWPVHFLIWPLWDEVINGYYAMRLNQHWDWHPFFFWTQLPPLLIWMLALAFKTIPSTLAAIRILPLLISLAILPLAYHSLERFYSKSTSILFLSFVATGFGFLYFGKICHQGLLLLFFEFLAFDCMGGFLKAPTLKARRGWLVVSGGVLGLGFYTYFSWPVVALALVLPILVGIFQSPDPRQQRTELFYFFGPLLLVLFPLLGGLWNKSFGTYYPFMLAFNRPSDSLLNDVLRSGESFSGLFWGYPLPEFYYGPVWGGMFNPLSGGLAILGGLWLSQRIPPSHLRWILFTVPLFMAPVLLSAPPLSEMRIIQILPLVAFMAVQGLERLVENIPKQKSWIWILMAVLISGGLDSLHLVKARNYLNGYYGFMKTEEFPLAYPILERKFQKEGPGELLFNLNMSLFHDYSCRVACFPFNTADNPKWSGTRPSWLGVLTNIHYRPFLEREFPQGHWYWLSRDLPPLHNNYNGGLMLGILPITDENRQRLEGWRQLNDRLDGVLQKFTASPPGPGREIAMAEIDLMGPSLKGDPFLQSSYWDLVYGLHNFENIYGHPSQANYQASFRAIQRALQNGYPTAYFYNELGSLYVLQKNYTLAGEAYEKALKAPLNLTPAESNLQWLNQFSGGNPAPVSPKPSF